MATDETQARMQFDRGLENLERYLHQLDEPALLRAEEAFQTAATLTPDEVSCWTALGFVLDASGRREEAATALQRANAIDPDDDAVAVMLLTLLSESGAELEALAAVEAHAEKRGIELESLRRDLTSAGMPLDSRTLLLNGFVRARSFLQSWLEDEIETSRRRRDPAVWARRRDAEWRQCAGMQAELQATVNPDSVPATFRVATPWASRLGVGDNICRRRLMENLTELERSELGRVVREHAGSIHSWLDGFGSSPLTAEAAAFMYLLLGVEETSA